LSNDVPKQKSATLSVKALRQGDELADYGKGCCLFAGSISADDSDMRIVGERV